MKRFFSIGYALAASLALLAGSSAHAQATPTKIKFTLDWRFEAPAAAFLLAKGKGYFDAENLSVDIDVGAGSGLAISRVASGAYNMGFADLASVMEFLGNNPTAPQKPVAVMLVYNTTPSSIFALKKSGIRKSADLIGRKVGGPVFDSGRRAFPIFAKANGIDPARIEWASMDPALREAMLVKGEVEAISAFNAYSIPTLAARGVKEEDLVMLDYADYGVKLYGHSIITSVDFAKKNPDAVKAFLRAMAKAYRDTIANPAEAIKYVKQREPLIDEKLQLDILTLMAARLIGSPETRRVGFGDVSPPRVALMASQVSDAFNTKTRVDATQAFDSSYLPSKEALNIFATPKAVTR